MRQRRKQVETHQCLSCNRRRASQGKGCGSRRGGTRKGDTSSCGPLRAWSPSWENMRSWELSYHGRTSFVCLFIETGSHCISLTGLELNVQTTLALNSQNATYLYLWSAWIKVMCHHTQRLSTLLMYDKLLAYRWLLTYDHWIFFVLCHNNILTTTNIIVIVVVVVIAVLWIEPRALFCYWATSSDLSYVVKSRVLKPVTTASQNRLPGQAVGRTGWLSEWCQSRLKINLPFSPLVSR